MRARRDEWDSVVRLSLERSIFHFTQTRSGVLSENEISRPAHHRPGGGFRNPWPNAEPHGFGDLVRWMVWQRLTQRRPPDPHPGFVPRATPAFVAPRATADRVTTTWIGHSTFLIQIGGLNVLTDPMWSDRASPVTFAGPRRWMPPAIPLDALPPIDVVLQSHNHYDHLDDTTVRRLADRFPDARWLVPLGLGDWLRRRGVIIATELDWWQPTPVEALTITATPAQHFSARGFGDRCRSLWCGFVVATPASRVYFAGDTALHPDFATIGARLGPFDLVHLPVGAYEPRWFMQRVHMNPDDAVQAYAALIGSGAHPPCAVMHWGTFKLTDEPMDEPPRRMRALWTASGLPAESLWIQGCGETREVIGARTRRLVVMRDGRSWSVERRHERVQLARAGQEVERRLFLFFHAPDGTMRRAEVPGDFAADAGETELRTRWEGAEEIGGSAG